MVSTTTHLKLVVVDSKSTIQCLNKQKSRHNQSAFIQLGLLIIEINVNFDSHTKKQTIMKSRLTLLLLLVTFVTHAQYDYYDNQTQGLRLNFGNFAVDGKFLLTMLSTNGNIDGNIEKRRGQQSNISSTTTEFSDKTSNKFKLKPGVAVSVSFYL